MKQRYSESSSFPALRACWTILRGGSVAWNLDIAGTRLTSRSQPLFMAYCLDNGKPVGPGVFRYTDPERQER